MNLGVQIQSFIFSFVFGFLFSYGLNFLYKRLFTGKIIFKIIWNFFFVVGSCLIYFYFIIIINHASIHIYFLGMALIGYLVGNLFSSRVRKI